MDTASRMESTGISGRFQGSESTHGLLKAEYKLEHRGRVKAKGKGKLNTYFLVGRA